jgi:hypothetical protein
MAEQVPFPKTLFSKDEQQNQVKDSVTGEVLCGSKVFQSQEEVDAAGGNAVWKNTPQEAQQSQSQQQPQIGRQPLPSQPPVRPPQPDEDEDEGTPPPPRRR